MDIQENLFIQAKNARLNAYTPYSCFKVGAAVLSEKNNIYASCNVENVSYPCGTCAEAGAIASMVAGGDQKIKKILVVADSEVLIKPCGACLQRILEFSTEETVIYLADLEGIKQSYKMVDLLPISFNEKGLKHE